ncbi:MAG TPA: GNAT family N-acetyltransferase [Candidatus Limnocylindrales bacterium]
MTPTKTSPASTLPGDPPVPGLEPRFVAGDADYEALGQLIRDAHTQDGIPWLPTADSVRLDLTPDLMDVHRDVVLVELEGRLVAMTAVPREVRADVPMYDVWGKVAPGLRRRGIGRWLLDWSIERARQRAAVEDPVGPVTLGAHAGEQEIGARALYESVGLQPARHFFLMRRERLDLVEPLPLPDGLEMRPVSADQHRRIYEAETEAFLDHWEPHDHGEEGFRQTFSQPETNTDLWAVAWDGDQVAGVVETWIWPEENRRLRVRRGWLEKISVRRPWRKRGLARALTAAAMIKLREAGMDEAMLGVDAQNPSGALGLYESLGFSVFRRSVAYRRPLER